jgi:hypothetical protein
VARARWSALFTDATDDSMIAAASAADSLSTSHKISAARCRAGRCCSAVTNARRTESRDSAISAGSSLSSGIGVTQMSSAGQGRSSDSLGGEEGPRSIGSARRLPERRASRHTFVAILYSQDRTDARPSNPSAFFQARSIVSCTASSASKAEPSIR